uniref:Cytochrome c-553 n=1 Tax=Dicranema revolutum TaxID=239144 RepID=A0A4D6WU86_9FLOR|nr:cytochrome c553 [Dicranema revolutum]
MIKSLSILLLVSNIFLAYSQNSLAADLEAGEEIFTANCSACHLNGANSIMPEKTLKGDALEANGMNSISAITNQVKNGKAPMPPFGERLSDEEIDNVANYVLTNSVQGW